MKEEVDKCIGCGAIIPYGRVTCPMCDFQAKNKAQEYALGVNTDVEVWTRLHASDPDMLAHLRLASDGELEAAWRVLLERQKADGKQYMRLHAVKTEQRRRAGFAKAW